MISKPMLNNLFLVFIFLLCELFIYLFIFWLPKISNGIHVNNWFISYIVSPSFWRIVSGQFIFQIICMMLLLHLGYSKDISILGGMLLSVVIGANIYYGFDLRGIYFLFRYPMSLGIPMGVLISITTIVTYGILKFTHLME